MSLPIFHVPEHLDDARLIQRELAARVSLEPSPAIPRTVLGVDVGYDPVRNLAHASLALLDYDTLQLRAQARAFAPASFPYVPGFLSFREIPAILAALAELETLPDLLMVDGQGIAHPRGLGIAAHLGVLLDLPAIGVAKSRLTGTFTMPGPEKGAESPLIHQDRRIGTVLRSRENVAPLFLSPGHRMDIAGATAHVLHCLTRYRLPEPTRLADKYSKLKNQPPTQPALL